MSEGSDFLYKTEGFVGWVQPLLHILW